MTQTEHPAGTRATGEPATGTSYAEAMRVASDLAMARVSRATTVPTLYERDTRTALAVEYLTALRHDLASAVGNDRWIAVRTAADLADTLREKARLADAKGNVSLTRALEEQAKACDQAVRELLDRQLVIDQERDRPARTGGDER